MAQNPDPAAPPPHITAIAAELGPLFGQNWTCPDDTGGRSYPIVDNKYYDLNTGQVKTYHHSGQLKSGPPSLDVCWHSRCRATGDADEFRGGVKTSSLTVTEYLLGVAAFLEESNYELHSLTATKYTVNIFISANMSKTEVHRLWLKYGL